MRNPLTPHPRGWVTTGYMALEYRLRWGYLPRQAVRYSEAESKDIIEQFNTGFSVDEIAEWHERTANGVSMHLERCGAFGDQPAGQGPSA